jgi:hypothetical protein
MPLEIAALTLTAIAGVVAVAMLVIGCAGLVDPAVIARCQNCGRWMTDSLHQGPPVCFRCRHHH